MGFGDGRNMPLLHDFGFEIYGVEISDKSVADTERMEHLGVPVHLALATPASSFQTNSTSFWLATLVTM
jgi:hypothetical protein